MFSGFWNDLNLKNLRAESFFYLLRVSLEKISLGRCHWSKEFEYLITRMHILEKESKYDFKTVLVKKLTSIILDFL